MAKLWTIIMAGGSGERLWPLSRKSHPKQTLRLGCTKSLLQTAADRLKGLVPLDRTVVVTTKNQAVLVRRQLPGISSSHFLIEPASRNTAAAIGLGTVAILQEDPDAVILVVPADHIIHSSDEFRRTVQKAVALAIDRDGLVCLGIRPTYPAIGYGYIEPMGQKVPPGGFRVRRFIEKPTLDVARKLVRRPSIVWNGGIFCWRGQIILSAIRQWLPRLYAGLDAIRSRRETSEGRRRIADLYRRLPSISIDVGVLERSRHVWMIPAHFSWDDVGSWNSLGFLHAADAQGNLILGLHVGLETSGSIVVGSKGHLVATLGVRDLIVVQTKDATLICHKNQAQTIRKMVSALAENQSLRKYL